LKDTRIIQMRDGNADIRCALPNLMMRGYQRLGG
jgi:hypothetical protein